MGGAAMVAIDDGVEVLDIEGNAGFAARRLHVRDAAVQMAGMERLGRAFVERPETILEELVRVAVDLCGADSAGISILREDAGTVYFEWTATAGEYVRYLHARLPQHPSPCGTCLERGRPQLFRVSQPFFELIGVEAAVVTDGILLPWRVDEVQGTLWIVAHGRTEAFDGEDLRMMQTLANFAAMGVRQQGQQRRLMRQMNAAAAAAMANELAHAINNPLQSLTNVVYLAAQGESGGDARELAREISGDVDRLSELVRKLLTLPKVMADLRASGQG